MGDICPTCHQDIKARDHSDCQAWESDRDTLARHLHKVGAPAACADAAMYVLGRAPVGTRLTIALATVAAWIEATT
jgi:hypothetical protein